MSIHLKTVLYKAVLLSLALSLLGVTIALAAAGDLDPSFSGDGRVTTFMLPDPAREDAVLDIAIQPNGKIVAAGYSRVPPFDPFFDPETVILPWRVTTQTAPWTPPLAAMAGS
jgi:hypothetical protein